MDRERFIRSFDGTELFVSTSGSGEVPLVLCDGLGCDGFIWRFLEPHFRPRHRIVRWHYRGHGLSKTPADPAGLTVEAMRRDLLAVLDAEEVERVVLVGHSVGCQLVLDFGLEHPERTLGVVPICGSYGRPLDTFHDNQLLATTFPFLRGATERWPGASQLVWRMLLASEMAYQVATRFEVNGRLFRRSDFDPYFQHLAGMDPRVFVRLAESANQHTVEERLGELERPVLIIAGERDTFTPVWLSKRMQQLIPGADLLVMPGGTHVAPIELPELVHLRLERFLEERISPLVSAPPVSVAAQSPAAPEAAAPVPPTSVEPLPGPAKRPARRRKASS